MDLARQPQQADALATAVRLAETHARRFTPLQRKELGQYFTPVQIARFMAGLYTFRRAHLRLLDPGAGTGVLSCALCQAFSSAEGVKAIELLAYETDPNMLPLLEQSYTLLKQELARRRIKLSYEIRCADFILHSVAQPFTVDGVVMNPPYFKLAKSDPRAQALPAICHGQPNIYALFMAQAASMLNPGGQMISITPRSFASGAYFRRFREYMFTHFRPDRLHLFERRDKAFGGDKVLQESVIARFVRPEQRGKSMVAISSSSGLADLGGGQSLLLPLNQLVDLQSSEKVFCMPTSHSSIRVFGTMNRQQHTLRSLGCRVLTGPVVAFRCQRYIHASLAENSVPLLWLQNLKRMDIRWPLLASGKPQYFERITASEKLLVREGWYVLVRRFSAKEETARVVAAPFNPAALGHDSAAVENHLNIIIPPQSHSNESAVKALTCYLNSTAVDEYVRMTSGNTQVGAAELLALPCPDWPELLAGAHNAHPHELVRKHG